MIEGVVIFVLGMFFGKYLRGRQKAANQLGPGQFTCGCGHNRSFHKDGTGPCKYKEARFGYPICGCQHYVGPEPLPEYLAN